MEATLSSRPDARKSFRKNYPYFQAARLRRFCLQKEKKSQRPIKEEEQGEG